MKEYDVIIVGGGVSGMTLASTIKNKSVLIIEGNDRIGKKLLSTGNGKCNLINKNLRCDKYNDGLYDVFEGVKFDDIVGYYESIGLVLRYDDEGRGYPYSESATTVLDAYRNALLNNVEIRTSEYVEKIERSKCGYKITSQNGEYFGKNAVIATGSDASFGRDSLSLFKGFGEVSAFKPSLVPLITKTENIKGLNGVRVKCRASIVLDGKVEGIEDGEVLFKTFGISGIAIFNLSSIYARSSAKKAYISLNLMSEERSEVLRLLTKRFEMGFNTCDKMLSGIFHKMIVQNVQKLAGVSIDKLLNNEDIEKIADVITDYRIEIVGCADKSLAQVMHGGLKCHEVNKNTLELKGAKGLYAIGECVDVDGASGGYNIMWAVASALTVSRALNKA